MTSKHERESRRVLGDFKNFMESRHYLVREDKNWPFHVLVPTEDNRTISVYCGGSGNYLEVVPLKKNGTTDRRYLERGFLTVRDAYNYLTRNFFLTVT